MKADISLTGSRPENHNALTYSWFPKPMPAGTYYKTTLETDYLQSVPSPVLADDTMSRTF